MLGTGTGSEIRQPLGYAMVGGLTVSQALTLFTTPIVYLYLDKLSNAFSNWGRSERRRGRVSTSTAPSRKPPNDSVQLADRSAQHSWRPIGEIRKTSDFVELATVWPRSLQPPRSRSACLVAQAPRPRVRRHAQAAPTPSPSGTPAPRNRAGPRAAQPKPRRTARMRDGAKRDPYQDRTVGRAGQYPRTRRYPGAGRAGPIAARPEPAGRRQTSGR